ncbi:hypothetical protein CY35_07G085400 [Sphagnum magellanicum]|uniref:Uncharacterized protein n=1 Tax=Sphagnum magellanicum TaxID=128215 RepID=A0ACB8HMK0_9BRYO|nr:hypothetical protein CY35_07G085400 [Sphagnum magellanicum]
MEDFANILQRDYGLKPQGKAAPMTLLGTTTTTTPGGTAATGSHRPAVSSFEERKSWRGGNGSNRSTRAPSAAARPAAEGRQEEEGNLFFRQSNGVSKPASRSSADPSVFFRASSDKVYQGATKSGYDDVYGEPSSGSSLTSSSFGNLLGGFNGSSSKLRTWTSQGSFNEDLLGGSGPTKMRPMAWAVSNDVYLAKLKDQSEKRSQLGLVKNSGEDELLRRFEVSKPGMQAGAFHGSFEGDLVRGIQSSKSDGPMHSSVDGDLSGEFGKPEIHRPLSAVKPSLMHPSQSESKESGVLPGFQIGEPIQATESTESTVAPNSSSIDDLLSSPAEADMSAGINSSSGSTLPASEASAFPEPLDPSSAGSSGPKSLSRANSNTDGGMHGPLDGYLKPVPVATAKAKEPTSPSKTAADSGGSVSSGDVHNGDGRAVQKSFSNSLSGSNHMDNPVLSPMYPAQPLKGKQEEQSSHDFQTFDEPVAVFEVKSTASDAGMHQSSNYHAAAKIKNSTGEIWLTINDVKLVTKPSASPPPSRDPPHPPTEKGQPIPVVLPDIIIEDLGEVVKSSRQGRRGEGKKDHAREEEWVKGREGGTRHRVRSRDPTFLIEPEVGGEKRDSQVRDHIQELTAQEKRHSSGAQKVVDDWTSFFAQPTAFGDEFRETEGEPAERRRIRLEKHQRIEERAAKALEEKNQRDMALQMEQEERHRLAGNLDAEIRRWSMGKEGNLRALLSSLHLILWPECNWKPVSLTDLITAPLVKKAYKSAILCVHPDKVQQKGATVQQKYIAEKVFDLLKDSFAKFNANELC